MSDENIINIMNDFHMNDDDVLFIIVITKRNSNKNKNKNKRKFTRQFLNVISINAKTDVIINQIIDNIYNLTKNVELFQKKHNQTMINIAHIKHRFEIMITKKTFKT